MKKLIRLFSLLLCFAMLIPLCTAIGITASAEDSDEFYVAVNGDDNAAGTKEAPLATLEGAQKAVRARIAKGNLPTGGITVYVRGGDYAWCGQLDFGAEDSGTESCPILWTAYENEEVNFVGTASVSGSKFTAAPADIKAQLKDKTAASKLMAISFDDLGCGDIRYVFVNGKKSYLARTPNAGYYTDFNGEGTTVWGDTQGVIKTWKSVDGVKICGYLESDYFFKTGNVISFDGTNFSTDTALSGFFKYAFYNVIEELDAPGEYYVDGSNRMLYMVPTDDFKNATITVPNAGGDGIVANGLQYVTFRNLNFSGCFGNAVKVENGTHVVFDACDVSYIGGKAYEINGFNNIVENSTIFNIGGAGITVSGGDKLNMIPSNSLVYNNNIHDYALDNNTYQPGVGIGDEWGSGITISHNEIYNSVHNGINGGCADSVIEYNIIHDVCTEAADAGAIYTGRYEPQEQTYRYNLIYNVVNIYGQGSPNGIYVDDGGGYKIAYGNIFCNVGGNAFAIGGGPDNQIYNNVMIQCGTGVNYDSRAFQGGWGQNTTEYPDGLLWKCLFNAEGYLSRNWLMRYPRVTFVNTNNNRDLNSRWCLGSFGLANIRSNVFVACQKTISFEGVASSFVINRDNAAYASIEAVKFRNAANYQFSIGEDSPVWNDVPGFPTLPVEQMGNIG